MIPGSVTRSQAWSARWKDAFGDQVCAELNAELIIDVQEENRNATGRSASDEIISEPRCFRALMWSI
jgi:hypothetical protein